MYKSGTSAEKLASRWAWNLRWLHCLKRQEWFAGPTPCRTRMAGLATAGRFSRRTPENRPCASRFSTTLEAGPLRYWPRSGEPRRSSQRNFVDQRRIIVRPGARELLTRFETGHFRNTFSGVGLRDPERTSPSSASSNTIVQVLSISLGLSARSIPACKKFASTRHVRFGDRLRVDENSPFR